MFKCSGECNSTTIPVGTSCESLADENDWAGLAYIMKLFVGWEISAEQFAV